MCVYICIYMYIRRNRKGMAYARKYPVNTKEGILKAEKNKKSTRHAGKKSKWKNQILPLAVIT